MAKPQPKKRSPVVYLGGLLLVVVAYTMLTPADETKATAKPKSSSAKKKGLDSIYTKDDYAATPASFKAQKGLLVNAFKPLILRSGVGESKPGDIPGAANWAYSGMATIDGTKKACLENSSTGDTVFLTKGDRWLQYTARAIFADHIDLDGPDGPLTVSVLGKDSDSLGAIAGGSAPIQVPLQGNIGSQNLTVLPDTTTGTPRRRTNAN